MINFFPGTQGKNESTKVKAIQSFKGNQVRIEFNVPIYYAYNLFFYTE